MAAQRSYMEDFEDLYNQVSSGFDEGPGHPPVTSSAPAARHPVQQKQPMYDQRGYGYEDPKPRPLPAPGGSAQARPLPRPPPGPMSPSGGSDYYSLSSPTNTSPVQGIKRLPIPPPSSNNGYSNGYYASSQASSSTHTPGGYYGDGGSRGQAYSNAGPGSRPPQTQPAYNSANVPTIDITQQPSASPSPAYGTPNRRPLPNNGASPLIPPGGGGGYGSTEKGYEQNGVGRTTPSRSHTARQHSTNTFSSLQSGGSGSGRMLHPNGPGQGMSPVDDFDTAGGSIGATLLRSSSAASSLNGSPYPMQPGSVDRASLTSAPSRTNSAQYSGGNHAPQFQQLQNPQYDQRGGRQPVDYQYIPPSGSDVKTNLYDDESSYFDDKSLSAYYNDDVSSPEQRPGYDDRNRHAVGSGSGRRLTDDVLLNDRLTDLKQRLGKLDIHDPDMDEFNDDHVEPDAVDEEFFDEEEEDDSRFMNLALLSHIAVRLRDKVPRATHVKGSIPYPRAFTGKDIVSTIQSIIQRELLISLGISTNDRRIALQVARSFQNQLFFYEVEWGGRSLSDSVEDVYMFLDDSLGGGDEPEAGPSSTQALAGFAELPTGVITLLTKCYSPSCTDGPPCYSYGCPKRGQVAPTLLTTPSTGPELDRKTTKRGWKQTVPQEVIDSIGEREVRRQNIIFKMIEKEEQYIQDLEFIDAEVIKPIRAAANTSQPIILPQDLDLFIDDIFGNVLDLRETNKRLLENMFVRQREQRPVIQRIGDIFLTAAAEFRYSYPIYMGHLPTAEKRLKDEVETNAEFRLFTEQLARHPDARRLDLKHFITRPSDHLRNYPVLLEAAMKETDPENPDVDFLSEAAQAIRNLSNIAQLRTFQAGMARLPNGPKEWSHLVSKEMLDATPHKEQQRQSVLFEIIWTEMEYVRDLENAQRLLVRPLRSAVPPIIPRERLNRFIKDAFWNLDELLEIHRRMLDRLHEIQREEHPYINSLTAPIFDAALNWRDAYMEYVPHYPISWFIVQDEMGNNSAFKTFLESVRRNPEALKTDVKGYLFRPIPRMLRYDLLLSAVLKQTPAGHEDIEAIPNVLEIIKSCAKATQPGVATAERKVELWNYNANLVFKPGEAVDMDLLDETRQLVHAGKLLRQPDGSFELSGWTELFVLLFDNYLVMTKPKERDGVTKYYANKRPIPLELLSLVGFSETPQTRSVGLFGGGLRRNKEGGAAAKSGGVTSDSSGANNPAGPEDNRTVYPCSIHHAGRVGGLYHLFAESAEVRAEWKQKLDEAINIRAIVQESNKVFETRHLSDNTFVVPSIMNSASQGWSSDIPFTGKVTCSVPFSTADGRGLVAVGCAEGVWIGLRSDKHSLRRVLHLKMVTQCAMLEDFGIFLVLADKSLFAYHIEALVPSANSANSGGSRVPQKLNGTKDVQFFSVGTLGTGQNTRTLIIYMKKKGLDSVFRVLEPVIGKITEKAKQPATFGRSIFGGSRSEWFRVYRDFFLPSESFDLVFLKAKIAILCTKGFEIMDLTDFKSVTIPARDDPRLAGLAKRCESCRPMGMFRSSENEFLLCYDEFGLYVDRHGDPNRPNGVIEWEGTAERVAFHPPYVVIFDSRFIEVRHIERGQLVQIIRGADIRCLWDGRGATVPPVNTPGPGGWDETSSLESRIHAVMKSLEAQPNTKTVVQTVFELVPTVPLFAPPNPNLVQQQQLFQNQNSFPQQQFQTQTQNSVPQFQGHNHMPLYQQSMVSPDGSSYFASGAGSPPNSPGGPAMQTWR